MTATTLNFKEWLETHDDDLPELRDIDLFQMEGLYGWGSRQVGKVRDKIQGFRDWLRAVKRNSVTLYRFVVFVMRNLPDVAEAIFLIPSMMYAINKSRLARELATNKSLLAAIQELSKDNSLNQNAIKADIARLKEILSKAPNEAAAAEEFWRSSLGKFVGTMWHLSHLGPILSRIPQVTLVNSWKTLQSFYDSQKRGIQIKGGVATALAAAIELFQFVVSASLMTGLLGKALIAMKMVGLGLAMLGGSWIVWGVLALMHKDEGGGDEKSFVAKVIAGLVTAVDPGARLGLVDRMAGAGQQYETG